VGLRTILMAYLSDAETIEIYPKLSRSMREEDLNFFFESMEWINEDLKQSGLIREENSFDEAKQYISERYEILYRTEFKKKKFEQQTSFNIDQFLGRISNPEYVDMFLKHIQEHKWYMNERSRKEVTLAEATKDWYRNIFVPLSTRFRSEKILDVFKGKTAAELYIEIMTNKYFMSERAGKDVGMMAAMKDYAQKFGVTEKTDSLFSQFSEYIAKILDEKESFERR
jgi:hypothetical protein